MHGQAGIRGVRVESDATTNYYHGRLRLLR